MKRTHNRKNHKRSLEKEIKRKNKAYVRVFSKKGLIGEIAEILLPPKERPWY